MTPNTDDPNADTPNADDGDSDDTPDADYSDSGYPKLIHLSLRNRNRKISPNTKKTIKIT